MKTREAIVAFSALSAVGLAAATLTYTGENGGGTKSTGVSLTAICAPTPS